MGSFGRVLKWFLEPYGKGVGLGRLATLNIHSICDLFCFCVCHY